MPSKFPPIPDYPLQPWIDKMPTKQRATQLKSREKEIYEFHEAAVELFRSIEDFNDVSDEAIDHMSTRIAIAMRNCFDDGMQQGWDANQAQKSTINKL